MKRVVDAVVDEQLDAATLAAEAYKAGAEVGPRLVEAARRVLAARKAGKLTAPKAKQLLREAYVLLTLDKYADLTKDIVALTDRALGEQRAAAKEYGKPLSTIPVIRNADIKARDNERRGITNAAGKVDGQ